MTDCSQAADDTAQPLHSEVKLLAGLMSLCRVTLLYGDAGTQRENLLRSSVVTLLQDARQSGQTELVILFDAWDRAPLAALHAGIHAALAPIISTPTSETASRQPLPAALRSWQEAYNIKFLIIFDRFDEYLIAPLERDGVQQFEDEFVQALNDATLRANFLLVLNPEAEPLLERLRDRVPRLGNDCMRLLSASQPIGQPLGFAEKDAALVTAPNAEQNSDGEPSSSPDAAETLTPRADVTDPASLHRHKGAPAFAITLFTCALAGGILWFAQRAPGPVTSVAEQRLAPGQAAEVDAGERRIPAKIPAEANEPPRESAAALPVEQVAPPLVATEGPSASPTEAMRAESKTPAPKPQATAARRGKAPGGARQSADNAKSPLATGSVAPAAEVQLSQPSAPLAEPTHAAISEPAARPQLTVDQLYDERAAKECEQGVWGAMCRQKIRYQVCAGKWTQDEPPGMMRCNVRAR